MASRMHVAQRRARVLEMDAAGATIQDMATELGEKPAVIYKDMEAVAEMIHEEQRDKLKYWREIVYQRFKMLIATKWDKAMAGDMDALEFCRKANADFARTLPRDVESRKSNSVVLEVESIRVQLDAMAKNLEDATRREAIVAATLQEHPVAREAVADAIYEDSKLALPPPAV